MSAIQQLMMSFGAAKGLSIPGGASGAVIQAVSPDGESVMGIRVDSAVESPWAWRASSGHSAVYGGDLTDFAYHTASDASLMVITSGSAINTHTLWDGVTSRAMPSMPDNNSSVAAISANGDVCAIFSGGTDHLIYSGLKTYLATGAGLTYRLVTAPVGYNTYVGIGYLKNDGAAYATVTHTATGQKHLARLAPAAEVFSVVMSSFDTGFDVDGLVAPSDDTDAVVVQSANADYSVVRAHLYDHSGGATLLPNPSGQIWPISFIGATGTVAGMTTDGVNTPFVWTPGGGLVSLAQPMTGDSPSSRVVAPPDGSRLLVLGCPDSTAYPQDDHLFIYDGASYTMLDKPAPTLVSVQSPWSVYASADFGVIGTAWADSDDTTSFWAYLDGVLVSLGAP